MIRNFLIWTQKEKTYSTLSDEELLVHFRNSGNQLIISELFDRYIQLVYAVCLKYYSNRDYAKDAAMEIFEFIGPKLLRYEVGNFKSWLYSVTRNHCLMQLRKKVIVVNNEEKIISSHENMDMSEEMHLFNEEPGMEQILIHCLNKLKEAQRICIELFYLKSMTYKDIALDTGYSELEIKSHIQNGKRNLKLIFESRNGQHKNK